MLLYLSREARVVFICTVLDLISEYWETEQLIYLACSIETLARHVYAHTFRENQRIKTKTLFWTGPITIKLNTMSFVTNDMHVISSI